MSFRKRWFSFAGEFLSKSWAPDFEASDRQVQTQGARDCEFRPAALSVSFLHQRGHVLKAGPRSYFSSAFP